MGCRLTAPPVVVIGGVTATSLQLPGGFDHDGRQRTGDDQHPVEAVDAHVVDVSRGVADDHLKEEHQTQLKSPLKLRNYGRHLPRNLLRSTH